MKVRARFVTVALIAIALFAAMHGHDGIFGTSPQISTSVASGHVTSTTREPSTRTQALPVPLLTEAPVRSAPSGASRRMAEIRGDEVSVGLSAEANQNPNVGDVFQLELNTDSRRAVARFTVTVNYDPLMLRVVAVRSSEFIVRPTDIANFTVRTSPNTEGRLIVSWDGRSIVGKGVLGHVDFELYAGGSTEITLSDIEVVDVQGEAVEVPIPEPVRVERHLS